MNTKASNTSGNAAVDALSARKCKSIIENCTLERVQAAFRAQARWLRRKERTEHPDGTFDKAGRWYPSADEDCDDYTSHTRTPSRAWPNTYNHAARSLEHCEALEDANHDDVLLMRRAGVLDALDERTSTTGAMRKASEIWTALQVRAGLLQVAVVTQIATAGTTAANDDVQTSQTA